MARGKITLERIQLVSEQDDTWLGAKTLLPEVDSSITTK